MHYFAEQHPPTFCLLSVVFLGIMVADILYTVAAVLTFSNTPNPYNPVQFIVLVAYQMGWSGMMSVHSACVRGGLRWT